MAKRDKRIRPLPASKVDHPVTCGCPISIQGRSPQMLMVPLNFKVVLIPQKHRWVGCFIIGWRLLTFFHNRRIRRYQKGKSSIKTSFCIYFVHISLFLAIIEFSHCQRLLNASVVASFSAISKWKEETDFYILIIKSAFTFLFFELFSSPLSTILLPFWRIYFIQYHLIQFSSFEIEITL